MRGASKTGIVVLDVRQPQTGALGFTKSSRHGSDKIVAGSIPAGWRGQVDNLRGL